MLRLKAVFLSVFFLFAVVSAHAQSGTCTLSGQVFKQDGITPNPGGKVTVIKSEINGRLVQGTPIVYTANESGVISIAVARGPNVRVWLKADIDGFRGPEGQPYAIPNAATATLESLQAAISIPTVGLSFKNQGSLLSSGITTLNLSTGLTGTISGDVANLINNGVVSFNTRSGVVTLSGADVTTALGYTPADPAGVTFTGPVILAADPTTNLGAATKQYVDAHAGGGSGSVTSVDVTFPNIFSVTGGPVTTSGTIAATLSSQSANRVFAGPTSGSAATPAFRALVIADLPSSIPNANLANSSITINGSAISLGGSVTTVSSVATGNGLSGGTITSTGTINLNLNSSGGLTKTLGASNNELGISTGGVTSAMLAGSIADSKLSTISTAGKVSDSALSSNVTLLGNTATGSGSIVRAASPTLVTPVLGVATATSLNKVTVTQPATGSTLTIDDGFTLRANGNATVSGTNTGDQTITLTGDVTGSGTGSFATTLATVNSNVGSFTNASITVDAKGRITAASSGSAGGDVSGPSSSTDNAVARFDSTTGKLLQDSSATIGDLGNFTSTINNTTGSNINGFNVQLNRTAPSNTFGSIALKTGVLLSGSANYSGNTQALDLNAAIESTGTVANIHSINAFTYNGAASAVSLLQGASLSLQSDVGIVTNARGAYVNLVVNGGTVTNNYGFRVANPDTSGGGAVINNYGLYIDSQTAGSTLNYSIYAAGGLAHFGGIIEAGSGPTTLTDSTGKIITSALNEDAVTFAKFQNIATNKLLGRSTASSGDVEEISIGTGLTLSGGTLSATGGGGGAGDVVANATRTANRLTKWTDAAGKEIGNSLLLDDGSNVQLTAGLFQMLGATSSFPALKRSGATLEVKLADDSAYTSITFKDWATPFGGGFNGAMLHPDAGNHLSIRNSDFIGWAVLNSSGHLVPVQTDLDFGVTGNAPRNIVMTGFIEAASMTAPSAPASGNGRTFYRTNGGGKIEYCVRFPTGAVQVLATEP